MGAIIAHSKHLERGSVLHTYQVAVIARAVIEKLREERKEEIEAIREEICADVKVLRQSPINRLVCI